MTHILVSVTDYPRPTGEKALMFVHVRNKYYVADGIDVTVINHSAQEDYVLDGIRVITNATFAKENKGYDVLIVHAANLRHNYDFLRKYSDMFKRFIFFFHGHEVLYINKAYPKPYSFVRNGRLKQFLHVFYDKYKLSIWHKYYPTLSGKADFVFVSNWLREQFFANLRLSPDDIGGLAHVHVIHNSIGPVFETHDWNPVCDKKYDFITIRSNMDASVYCIDLLCAVAKKNPQYHFLLIGKGNYFQHNEKPQNMDWYNGVLTHEEIMSHMDTSRYAFALTRHDTQGVMTCEYVTYGMPTITSDIPICHEIFGDCDHIAFVPNDADRIDLSTIISALDKNAPYPKYRRYFFKNTVKEEVELINGND